MPYESPYAKAQPAQGLRAKVPGPVKLPAKKPAQPEAGGLLAGAASAIKNRKKLLDSL